MVIYGYNIHDCHDTIGYPSVWTIRMHIGGFFDDYTIDI